MIQPIPAQQRFHTQIDWLDSWHTFSFGHHFDPDRLGFRALRVINDDRVRGGSGFGTHGHRDMEILSYVLEGALEHRDSMGNGSIIRPGEVQRMSAGTGVRHSEWNASEDEPVHFLQIWIEPRARGLAPGYEQRPVPAGADAGRLRLLASPDGRGESVTINQDAFLYAATLRAGEDAALSLRPGRHAFVFAARGKTRLLTPVATALNPGDGVAVSNESDVRLLADTDGEALLFDLA